MAMVQLAQLFKLIQLLDFLLLNILERVVQEQLDTDYRQHQNGFLVDRLSKLEAIIGLFIIKV